MPRKPKTVPLSKVEDIQTSLKQKAATPKTISLDELVKTLAKPIQDMLDAGYDYSDVAEVFQGHGVELAASGIKSFYKKAISTTANQHISNEASVVAESESTDSATTSGDDISPVEPEASSPNTNKESSPPLATATTAKGGKSAAKTNSQFNVTNRSEL
ncbi:MAG: hypothetical protein KME59_22830 [Trichormus sp. ATA11-4-KO1]|jgi:hypothetical protein|nr:hypothetical protein [Trichormus sp. ATA11-4-KO1]